MNNVIWRLVRLTLLHESAWRGSMQRSNVNVCGAKYDGSSVQEVRPTSTTIPPQIIASTIKSNFVRVGRSEITLR